MKQTNEEKIQKTAKTLENNENSSNSNSETYQILKNDPKIIEEGRINNKIDGQKKDNEGIYPTIKRSNSIKLYKKHKKLKVQKEEKNKEKNKNDNIDKKPQNEIIVKEKEKPEISKIGKKVSFLPNFLSIIDVESYKKFNAENTCKDPFEDPEFLNSIYSTHIKSNGDNNKKDNAYCSCACFIF